MRVQTYTVKSSHLVAVAAMKVENIRSLTAVSLILIVRLQTVCEIIDINLKVTYKRWLDARDASSLKISIHKNHASQLLTASTIGWTRHTKITLKNVLEADKVILKYRINDVKTTITSRVVYETWHDETSDRLSGRVSMSGRSDGKNVGLGGYILLPRLMLLWEPVHDAGIQKKGGISEQK